MLCQIKKFWKTEHIVQSHSRSTTSTTHNRNRKKNRRILRQKIHCSYRCHMSTNTQLRPMDAADAGRLKLLQRSFSPILQATKATCLATFPHCRAIDNTRASDRNLGQYLRLNGNRQRQQPGYDQFTGIHRPPQDPKDGRPPTNSHHCPQTCWTVESSSRSLGRSRDGPQ